VRATFWRAKPITEMGGSARWRRTAAERRRLVNTDHDRFQGEIDEPCSSSASTAESRYAHESSGAPVPRCAAPNAEEGRTWLTYEQAARYAGWSVGHLRNLVSAGQIPVYGIQRRRRFRRDMLDLYLTDPDMAMRRFSAEGNSSHGR
jgi:excisionase family DNA binding protein